MGTDDVEAAGSIHGAHPGDDISSVSSFPDESYNFGSEDDLKAAIYISFGLLEEIRRAREDTAIVVLNFRALQARRIDEMQVRLLEFSRDKMGFLQSCTPGEPGESYLNENIDALLHKYGR